MSKTFRAHFPAKKNWQGEQVAAYAVTFTEMPNGNWMSSDFGSMFADEVAERCRKATNWREIKATHFPMDGFHGDENWQDNMPSHKSDL